MKEFLWFVQAELIIMLKNMSVNKSVPIVNNSVQLMENVLHVHKSLKNFKTESVFQQSIIVGQDNIFKMEYVLTLIPFVKFTKE